MSFVTEKFLLLKNVYLIRAKCNIRYKYTREGKNFSMQFQFFAGWWFIIDAASVYPGELPNAAHVCGVMATLSLLMVNSVSNAQVSNITIILS